MMMSKFLFYRLAQQFNCNTALYKGNVIISVPWEESKMHLQNNEG